MGKGDLFLGPHGEGGIERRGIGVQGSSPLADDGPALRPYSIRGSHAGGFVLTRHEGGGKWDAATYSAAQNTGGLGIEPDASYAAAKEPRRRYRRNY
jgi:hypothetical protein